MLYISMKLKSKMQVHFFQIPPALLIFIDKQFLTSSLVLNSVFKPINRVFLLNFVSKKAVMLCGVSSILLYRSLSFVYILFPSYSWLRKLNTKVAVFINQFNRLMLSCTYGHWNIIQLVGFRFRQRWFRQQHVLRYRLGYNKKIWFWCPHDFIMAIRKLSPKKNTHFFFSFNRHLLRKLIYQIHKARPSTLYKGRGVNIKEQPMVLKEGKKAQW
jgi:hypothetical protein